MTDPNAPVSPNGTTATPSTTAPTSGNPGNGTAPGGTAPAPEAWRPGPNAPSWAQGRSQEEILNIAAAAVDQLAKFNQSPAPMQQPQYQAPPQQPNRFDMDMPDDDFISGRQMKQILQQYGQQAQGDPVARQLAASGNMRTIQKDEADAFRRWGPEVHMEIAKLPPDLRSLDNLQLIVDIVKSRHVQELVDEQARQKAVQLAQEQVATIRSGTGGSTAIPNTQNYDLKSNELPEHWRELASKYGLTLDQVREFTQATGETMDQYFETVKRYGKGGVIHG